MGMNAASMFAQVSTIHAPDLPIIPSTKHTVWPHGRFVMQLQRQGFQRPDPQLALWGSSRDLFV